MEINHFLNSLCFLFKGLAKPANDEAKLEDKEDYPNDDGEDDYKDDEDESASSVPQNIAENSVTQKLLPPPFFRVTQYTEKARIGETIVLKCDAENADCKWIGN